jgi:ABC-type dipeptide/oligopeptide/nickel transport system ATPase component
MVMCGGRVVGAPPAKLFHDPQHPYSAGLLRSMPRLDETHDRLRPCRQAAEPAAPAERLRLCTAATLAWNFRDRAAAAARSRPKEQSMPCGLGNRAAVVGQDARPFHIGGGR